MIAGVFPAIFKALELDGGIKSLSESALQFKTLQDRFRQAALIGGTKPVEELEKEFKALMERMDKARSSCLAIPDRH